MQARGGGGGGTTIVINPEDLRQTSTIALEVGQAFHALAGQLGARPLPELPPAIAGRVSTELSEVCCLLNSEPPLLLETAQELRARAFWAEVADRLAAGYDLEGAQLTEFKAGMASGILQRYANEWEKELGNNYAKELHDRENPGGIGGFFKKVGGGIADFASGAWDSIKDPAVMLYHLTPLHEDWTQQWGALGSGLAHGVTHPLEFGRAVLALDALEERGLAYWLGNLAPAAAATVLSGGAAAGARGAAATERVAGGAAAVTRGSRLADKADTLSDAARFGRATSTDYRGTFFGRHPDLEGKVVVHHAVEQQVQVRYPGLVDDLQLHSYENLRGVPNQLNGDVHLSKIRKEWNRFYRTNPNPTQQDLLDEATRIDRLYGDQFQPPVGD